MFSKSKNETRRRVLARSNAAPGTSMLTRSANDDVWLHSSQLELGMYVNELDKPWAQTRFLFQGFVIDSYELLRQVQNSCEHANVQTLKVGLMYCKSAGRMMGGANP